MMNNSFYTPKELVVLGFKSIGDNVLISRKASIYNPDKISIGNNVRIDDFCVLSGGAGIEIGNYIHISCFSALYGGAGIMIEDFSTLSVRTTIFSVSDDYSGRSLTNPMVSNKYKLEYQSERVVLSRHVIVGANSTILPGVILGEGVAIGAHSLVRKSCEAWSIYSGCPAKKLKDRRRDILELEKQFIEEVNMD